MRFNISSRVPQIRLQAEFYLKIKYILSDRIITLKNNISPAPLIFFPTLRNIVSFFFLNFSYVLFDTYRVSIISWLYVSLQSGIVKNI